MATEQNFEERKKQLEIEKLELENSKLRKEQDKSWYIRIFNNVNILQILTAVIVITGAIAAYTTNYFQNQNTLLEIRKIKLEKEIEHYASEVKEIISTNQNLEEDKRSLTVEVNNLKNIKRGLIYRVSELQDTISLMLRSEAFIRKSAKKSLEFSMDYIGNNIDTTKLTSKELQIIRDEIYLTYLRIGSFEKQNSRDGNRIQEWAEKYEKEKNKNDSLQNVILEYKKRFKD